MTDCVLKGTIAGGNVEIAKWAYPKGFREDDFLNSFMSMAKWMLRDSKSLKKDPKFDIKDHLKCTQVEKKCIKFATPTAGTHR